MPDTDDTFTVGPYPKCYQIVLIGIWVQVYAAQNGDDAFLSPKHARPRFFSQHCIACYWREVAFLTQPRLYPLGIAIEVRPKHSLLFSPVFNVVPIFKHGATMTI